MRASSLLLPALLLSAAPALAQETTPAAPDGPGQSGGADDLRTRETITVGAGVATIPSYEGSDHNRIVPIAAARGSIKGFSFSTQGAKLFVDLIRDRGSASGIDLELGPVAGFNTYRTSRKSIDDRQVEALGKLDTAIELGGYAGIGKTGVITSAYDTISANVSYTHDVAGAHDSYTITPAISYGTPLSRKAYVGLSGSASYAGAGYARYYFQVTPEGAAASGLPAYTLDDGWKSYSISALGTYAITGDLLGGFSVVGGVSYSKLLGDFARSPVVSIAGDRDQWYGAIGLAYTF